jgi:uncharacterized protein Smg (DUF494 family)
MGDLIQKLPTDNLVMPTEEKENFLMLFPDEMTIPEEQKVKISENTNTNTNPRIYNGASTNKLKKEMTSLLLFVAVFFILNLPQVKRLIVEYIPMCNKSWIATNLVQAIVFAFVLWIVINSEYSRS